MARITVEDCIDKFESRFELVLVASNRARKLHSGENPTVEKDNDKPTVIALREIADETVTIESLKSKLIEEYQIVSPLDEEDLSLDYSGSENQLEEEVNIDKGEFDQKIEEVGTMSVVFRINDKLITPLTSDTILDGVTRKSVIQVARDIGIEVEERDITVKELISEFKSGNLKEVFGCGTAAVIAPINSFGYKDEKFQLEDLDSDFASKIKTAIINIQQNISDDTHNWRYKITE